MRARERVSCWIRTSRGCRKVGGHQKCNRENYTGCRAFWEERDRLGIGSTLASLLLSQVYSPSPELLRICSRGYPEGILRESLGLGG